MQKGIFPALGPINCASQKEVHISLNRFSECNARFGRRQVRRNGADISMFARVVSK
jgi:hypothetical protein